MHGPMKRIFMKQCALLILYSSDGEYSYSHNILHRTDVISVNQSTLCESPLCSNGRPLQTADWKVLESVRQINGPGWTSDMKKFTKQWGNKTPFGGFHSHGVSLRWMVYKRKPHLDMDDFGVPPFEETPMSFIRTPWGSTSMIRLQAVVIQIPNKSRVQISSNTNLGCWPTEACEFLGKAGEVCHDSGV